MKELQETVLQAALECYNEKLFAGTSGNLSVFDRETCTIAITPTGLPYSSMASGDIVLMRLDGTVLEPGHKPSSEWRLHAEIYKARLDVNAVVHTHSPYATSFAVAGLPVPLILIEMIIFLGGEVPLAEFAIPSTELVGTNAVIAMGSGNACLMANHGVVTAGSTLQEAQIRAVYVEDAARIATLAKINGGITTIPEHHVRALKDILAKLD